MLKVLKQARQSSILQIATVPPQSPRFAQLVNDATEQLMARGDWPGTVVPIHVCAKRGCVTWPRWIGEIRKLNICKRHLPIKNEWYEFIPKEPGWQDAWCGQECNLILETRAPVHTDIYNGGGRTVRAYASTPLDVNKKMWVFGVDDNGQTLMTKGIGGWEPGIELSLKMPYVESTDANGNPLYIRSIDRVVREATHGPVNFYAWNSTTLEALAQYDPSDVNPDYLRTQLHLPCLNQRNRCADSEEGSNPCPPLVGITALVKLKFIPAESDNDLVLIDNLTAIKKKMQSNLFDDAGDFDNARRYELDAVRELNYDVRDKNPRWTIPVRVNGVGRLGAQKIGTLI